MGWYFLYFHKFLSDTDWVMAWKKSNNYHMWLIKSFFLNIKEIVTQDLNWNILAQWHQTHYWRPNYTLWQVWLQKLRMYVALIIAMMQQSSTIRRFVMDTWYQSLDVLVFWVSIFWNMFIINIYIILSRQSVFNLCLVKTQAERLLPSNVDCSGLLWHNLYHHWRNQLYLQCIWSSQWCIQHKLSFYHLPHYQH